MPRREDGPRAEVGRLYDQYGAALYCYALMILADPAAAEDAIQQVFTALLSRARAIEQEEHYLRRAVRTNVIRRCEDECSARRARRCSNRSDRMPGRTSGSRSTRELPPDQREVLHLHAFEGRTFQEIADLTDESMNTIASRYRYAVAKLKQMLT